MATARKLLVLAALAVAVPTVLVPASALALDAQEILEKADAAVNPYKDRRMTVKMIIRDADGGEKVAKMKLAERRFGKQRIMIYTAPADVKGMGILVQDSTSMYIYLPEYNRVRRVAMHAKKQTFMDSDFAFEDMGAARLAPDYDAKLLKEGDRHVWLTLTPKAGKHPAYSKVEIKVDRQRSLIWELKYFDNDGKLLKTETRTNYEPVDGVKIQRTIRMTDARRKHSTDLQVIKLKVNLGLSRRLFTKRGLIRGKL